MFRWLLNDKNLMSSDDVELNSETGGLKISGLSYDNTGNYTCVAETGAGTDNITHTVTVSGEHAFKLCVCREGNRCRTK